MDSFQWHVLSFQWHVLSSSYAVWRDDEIESCPIFPNMVQKSSQIIFYIKVILFKVAQKLPEYLGYFCKKITMKIKNRPIWLHCSYD